MGSGERQAGFASLEALLALILTLVVVAGLSSFTRLWVGDWGRGIDRSQTLEEVALAIDRIAADLESAEALTLPNEPGRILFIGREREISFMRSSASPNANGGLETVALIAGSGDDALVRKTWGYDGSFETRLRPETNSARLLPRGVSMTFAYADDEGLWAPEWGSTRHLPTRVRITIASERGNVAFSTIVRTVVNASTECIRRPRGATCRTELSNAK